MRVSARISFFGMINRFMSYTIISTTIPGFFQGNTGKYFDAYNVEFEGKERLFAFEKYGDRVLVSDEGYWNPNAAVEDDLRKIVSIINSEGKKAGAAITLYALPEFNFGGNATYEQLMGIAKDVDFVALDPYLLDKRPTENLIETTRKMLADIHAMGKPVTLCLQGFAHPDIIEEVKEYNRQLLKLPFNEILVCDALDFPDIPDEWQLDLSGIYPPKEKDSIFKKILQFFKKIFKKIFNS